MRRLTNLFRESASLTRIKKSSGKLLQPSLVSTGQEGGTCVWCRLLVHYHFTLGILVLCEKTWMASCESLFMPGWLTPSSERAESHARV